MMIEDLTVSKAVDFAVETEKLGHRLYTRLAERFRDDPELRALFETLAEDEKHHAEQFGKLRELAKKDEPIGYEQQQYLRAISLSDIFSQSGIGKEFEEIQTREDALERALKLERTTLGYYQAMKDVLQSDAIDAMIEEEKKHLIKVTHYLVTGAKFRGLGDAFD